MGGEHRCYPDGIRGGGGGEVAVKLHDIFLPAFLSSLVDWFCVGADTDADSWTGGVQRKLIWPGCAGRRLYRPHSPWQGRELDDAASICRHAARITGEIRLALPLHEGGRRQGLVGAHADRLRGKK